MTTTEHTQHIEAAETIKQLRAQVEALTAERNESDAIRDKLALLLAGVAIALKGPELPLHRHGYHDLEKCAQVAMLEIELLKHLKTQIEAERDAHQSDALMYRGLLETEIKARDAAVKLAADRLVDAERYRYLRGFKSASIKTDESDLIWSSSFVEPEEIDAAIDAARAAS